MSAKDNLTLTLHPGERAALQAAAQAEGHKTLSGFVRSRLGLAALQRGRVWPAEVREAVARKRAARIEKLRAQIDKLQPPDGDI